METLSIVVMNWRDVRNPAAGGAELYIQEIVKRWVASGHRVTLLTSRFEGSAPVDVLDGVEVRRQGSRWTVYRRVRETYRESFRGRTDIVIDSVNTIPFSTPRYVNDGARLFVLIFQLAREGWFYETPWPVAVVGRYVLEEHWLRQYATVPTLTPSDSTRKDLEVLGFRDVHVVHPGVPSHPEGGGSEKETAPTLLFVGRLKKYKLPDHAIRAFRRIGERVPGAQLWMVGDGDMRKRLERDAPPGVTLFGHVTDAEKTRLMGRAHVLLCPSVREGWGLVVTEANSLGLPAIGYDVPGLRDSIQDGTTGCLVPANDTGAMADAAIRLLSDDTERERLAAAALQWARTFDWDKSAATMLRCIAGSLDSVGERPPSS